MVWYKVTYIPDGDCYEAVEEGLIGCGDGYKGAVEELRENYPAITSIYMTEMENLITVDGLKEILK